MNIIIPGEQNYGYALSKDCQARCDKALETFENNKIYGIPIFSAFDKIICSGGLFNKEQQGIPVAVAMKHYLEYMNCRVPVFTEEKSITSIHNVEEVIKWSLPHARIISSWYHIPRLWLIWKCSKTETKFVGAPCSWTIKRFFLELLGIYTFVLYALGFKNKELNFRRKRHETNNKNSTSNREVHTQLQSD